MGLWRSWERASMAWKRSSVRSRPGPPSFQQLTETTPSGLLAFDSKFPESFREPLRQFGFGSQLRIPRAIRNVLRVERRRWSPPANLVARPVRPSRPFLGSTIDLRSFASRPQHNVRCSKSVIIGGSDHLRALAGVWHRPLVLTSSIIIVCPQQG